MQERLIKVFVDGFNNMDIVDVQMYVTRALDKGLKVKRVTIGDNTFINPDWCEKKDAVQNS